MCICCYRAIDDLYTLAEMDGNLWQAHNIVQLLDESTTDFRQVSSCSLASRCHLHTASPAATICSQPCILFPLQLQAFLQSQGCSDSGIHETGAWPTRMPQSSPRQCSLPCAHSSLPDLHGHPLSRPLWSTSPHSTTVCHSMSPTHSRMKKEHSCSHCPGLLLCMEARNMMPHCGIISSTLVITPSGT